MGNKHSKKTLKRWEKQKVKRQLEADRCAEIAAESRLAGNVPTYDEIMAARTGSCGWKRETLAMWGLDWPPPKGWIDSLVRAREILDAASWR
jgi:hypothetical protein